jgi:hypothetical protein
LRNELPMRNELDLAEMAKVVAGELVVAPKHTVME